MEDRRVGDLLLEQHTIEEIKRYDDIKNDLRVLTLAVNELTLTWNQAKGVLTFVKWLIGIAGSVSVFILFLKDHFK
jgi:hypothetical protein